MFLKGDALHLPFRDRSVDLVFGSPPYMDARTYGIGAQRDCHEWVEWMLAVTREALRVSRGAVMWVVAGVTRDWNYWPGPEGLKWRWFAEGGSEYRPHYWHAPSRIPGSGGDQWSRADVEYVLCFKRHGPLPWADNTANGHPPKCKPGGPMSHRDATGKRKGRSITRGSKNGDTVTCKSPGLVLSNPGNLVTIPVGGGRLGNDLAHANEAPFPQELAEWFIRSWCQPGGVVLDCFSGSGSTVAAARKLGRVGIGLDIRDSQCVLGTDRCDREVWERSDADKGAGWLFAEAASPAAEVQLASEVVRIAGA